MRVERFLESVNEHNEQIGKLVRLQSFLRGEASRLYESDPVLSAGRLQQAQALAHDILQAYDECEKLIARVRRFIERLPDQTEREILKLCYLSHIHAETAADILGYSARHAYRIKQRALMHLEALR